MNLRPMTSVYFLYRDKMLLLYRVGSRVVIDPAYCGIGGHFEPEELQSAKACALREVREEIGLDEKDFENFTLRYVTLRLKNGEIRENYYFFADLTHDLDPLPPCSEGTLKWVPIEACLSLPMPHTAKAMLTHYLKTGRYDQKLYVGTAQREQTIFEALEEF